MTRHGSDVQCGPRFNTAGTHLCYVSDNRLQLCNIRPGERFGHTVPLSGRSDEPPTSPVWSHDERVIAVNRDVEGPQGLFRQVFLYKLADWALR